MGSLVIKRACDPRKSFGKDKTIRFSHRSAPTWPVRYRQFLGGGALAVQAGSERSPLWAGGSRVWFI